VACEVDDVVAAVTDNDGDADILDPKQRLSILAAALVRAARASRDDARPWLPLFDTTVCR
jgi:hypothetical protein